MAQLEKVDRQLLRITKAAVPALPRAIEQGDSYTVGHRRRVSHQVASRAEALGMALDQATGRTVLHHQQGLNGSFASTQGDAILSQAKIISVADVVQTMASHRP
jgi:HD-GYP domain-containing protein (c-di-GMP phosphodiesterase class II)